ncbi:hypothetical protein LZC95_35960 [Pendulispora brunnea]|uniref:Uncharacterized protein n=1 Tax=Pendulispora brunnea TaxID=2905690 RepID=A0ABZ2K3Y1_9BACT
MAEPEKTSSMKAAAKAATSALSLAVAGTATVGAVALHSWSVMALGGVAYATLVAWDLVSGNDKKKKQAPLRDPATRSAMQTLSTSRLQLDRVLQETPEDVKANLALVLLSVDELETRATQLATRAEAIAGYLLTTDVRVVEQGVRELEQRVRETRDPEARAHYESAKKAREEHLATLVELTHAKERIFASLVTICATMDAMPAKVVRMRALDSEAMDAMTGNLKDELSRMNDDMQSLEETLKSLSEVIA